MRSSRLAVVIAALVSACSDPSAPTDPVTPDPPSDNPIDVAIWPRLVATNLTDLPPATNDELCRRMALDLIGVAPGAEERATICANTTPEQIARGFMASPRFRDVERRFWIRRPR